MSTKPTEICYVVGDATDPPRDRPGILVHVCNDAGGWGKGFVMAVSRRWTQPERAFRAWAHGAGTIPFALGEVQFVRAEENLWVANLIGQHGIGRQQGDVPIRYEAIQQGLKRVTEQALASGAVVHMPRIGCGLAGGTWDKIEPILLKELTECGISVFVYDLPT